MAPSSTVRLKDGRHKHGTTAAQQDRKAYVTSLTDYQRKHITFPRPGNNAKLVYDEQGVLERHKEEADVNRNFRPKYRQFTQRLWSSTLKLLQPDIDVDLTNVRKSGTFTDLNSDWY